VSSMPKRDTIPHVSQDLVQAYLGTAYTAQTDAGAISLRIGVRSDEIRNLLAVSKASGAAFITAENPCSEPQTPAVNAERQQQLGSDLSAMGITYFPGEGRGEDPSWPAEASFLALGIDREAAINLGRKYGQNAIVWVGSDGVPELLLLTSNGSTL
jgi:hypothetical protein